MSRIPNPPARSTPSSPTKSSARTTARATAGSTTPTPRTRTTSTITSRVRPPASPVPPLRKKTSTKSLNSPSKPTSRRSPVEEPPPVPRTPTLSIKEQIALKRAEALKAKAPQSGVPGSSSSLALDGLEEALPETTSQSDLDLGRWSVKETIERARSSGALNLASRALPCLPSALFEIHLSITPEPLKLVPVEPNITTGESSTSRRKGTSQQAPSWFEAQDLEIIKAWSNEIVEIQPEIHMFGSLKTIDLHNNKLASLPDTFADLTALVFLDLSHNQLNSLPTNLWALPNLTTLNLSHNALTALPFSSPFASSGSNPLSRTRDPRGDWYGQDIVRATQPLPRLTTLDISHNSLSASSIDHSRDREDGAWLPNGITKLDLSLNPLGDSTSLLRALSRLRSLRELKAERADIGNESFPVDLLSATSSPPPFAELRVLDLGETRVTKPVAEAALRADVINKTLDWDFTEEAPGAGVLRVLVGKKVVKEAWEIEAERRVAAKLNRGRAANLDSSLGDSPFGSSSMKVSTTKSPAQPASREKEAWEVEAEQGLLTEGAKRRARAQAAATAQHSSSNNTSTSKARAPVAQKETWEIEAEQGLLTAGGRRRARAAAMAANLSVSPDKAVPVPSASPSPTTESAPPVSTSSAFSNPLYYNSTTQTLTLPPSNPPTAKNGFGHARSFSLAPSKSVVPSLDTSSSSDLALAIPTPTLPLATIANQSFAAKLNCLILNNRRMDPCFNLLAEDGLVLPVLEELSFENCNLGDTVPVSRSQEANACRTNESLIPLLTKLFPSLRLLDLSYNHLTSKALSSEVLSDLILARADSDPPRKGLRHLRLRGNKFTDIDGFVAVSGLFKGHKDSRDVESWKLEELDVRDNEIGRLPPELGLLPLDVLLVDGNVFRIPPRRVWEREGTKGLLSWLRGRVE